MCQNIIEFANGKVVDNIEDEDVTHIILDGSDFSRVGAIRGLLSL